jgi:hypothetical protein
MRKKKNIIIWVLTWAVLFLVVAYSPIGRPDLYVGNSYYISNQGGVNFKSGIANAPKSTGFTSTPDNNDTEGLSYAPSTIGSSNGAFSGNASKYSSRNFSGSSDALNSNIQQGSNNTSGNFIPMGYSNSNKSAAQGTATAQNNASSLTTYANISSTNRQSVIHNNPKETGNGYGGVNEGDDPTGPPIPVGDEWWLLLVMAGAYTFWRQLRATKLKPTNNR